MRRLFSRTWWIAVAMLLSPIAQAASWQAPAGIEQIPLWPESLSIARPETQGEESATGTNGADVRNVSRPTMSIFPAKGVNTGVAVIVFPGGGYRMLAMGGEGTDVCDWLVSRGITCVLLKYRVPGSGPYWNDACNCRRIPAIPMALQDAQRAMVLLRARAQALLIDPHKIGVVGFSAGGHLVAAISNATTLRYARVDAADDNSTRPDFAIALYPGHLWAHKDEDPATRDDTHLDLNPDIVVTDRTPPTFLVQAGDDNVDGVQQSLAYYVALQKAGVPTEMHIYPEGGHAFGLRPSKHPISKWPTLVEQWLRTIGVLAE
jgi:acetyl esterase/lipase